MDNTKQLTVQSHGPRPVHLPISEISRAGIRWGVAWVWLKGGGRVRITDAAYLQLTGEVVPPRCPRESEFVPYEEHAAGRL